MVALRVLGGFQVILDGREVVELTAQRNRAALLVLLGMECSTTRDSVVAVLWPEHDSQKARHALSQTLHRLRGSLGDGWLETEGDRLAITDDVEVDARTFEALVAAEEYEQALALYRGGFLAGWFLADNPVFEAWVDQQRAHFERLHRLARHEAIRLRRERGDISDALRIAQEWTEIDPLEDEAHHRLIELLAESGRRNDALRQFALYARLLEEEDLKPLDETVQLIDRLHRAEDLGPLREPDVATDRSDSVAEAPPDPVTSGEPPSAGRAPESPRDGLSARAWYARLPLWARVAGVAVASIAVGLILVVTHGASDAKATLSASGRVVLADFGNDTRDSLAAGVVTEMLRIDLKQYLRSALADPAEVAPVLARMRLSPVTTLTGKIAREVALRSGIPAVINGTVGSVGPGFVLSAWIVSVDDGHVVDAALATARDSTELIDAIASLSAQLLEKIHPSIAPLSSPAPLARVTTSSLDALRKYSVAMRIWREEADVSRALQFLDEAATLDSTFAMAYLRRATILMNAGGRRSAWIDALSKAYRHRDRLSDPERYLALASYNQNVTGNLDEAVRGYEGMIALDSADISALNSLGVLYRDVGDYPRAESMLRRCLAADSMALLCGVNLCDVVHTLGRWREARAIADATIRRFPETPFAVAQLGHLAAAEQDYDRADTLYADLSGIHLRNPAELELWLAQVDMVRGRLEEARVHLDSARRLAEGSDSMVLAIGLLDAAWMELEIRRDTVAAVEAMESALRNPTMAAMEPVDLPYLEVADFFLDAGRSDRATELLETFLTEVPTAWQPPEDRWLYILRGRMAMEDGRLDEAREAFRVAETYSGNPLAVLRYLGPLYALEGRPDSAIVSYERYLAVGSLNRINFDAVLLPGVLERLGELHEAAGHARKAAGYYQRLATLWAEADPELQPRAEAARRKALALLSGDAGTTDG